MCVFKFQQSVWKCAVWADVERCDWLFHPGTGVGIDWPLEVDHFLYAIHMLLHSMMRIDSIIRIALLTGSLDLCFSLGKDVILECDTTLC